MLHLPKYERIVPDAFTPLVTVEAPGYVHITVRINKSLAADHVYWHLVDPSFSLLELGFERSSRRLTHISIPLFKGSIDEIAYSVPECTQGDPLFDLRAMGFTAARAGVVPEVLKCQGRIFLNRSGGDIDILLLPSHVVQTICCQQKVIYGFDAEKRLCLIRLQDQTAHLTETVPLPK